MNGWKVTSIIFIILFVLETSFVIFAITYYNNELEKEFNCLDMVEEKGLYDYEYIEGYCFGYDEEYNLVLREKIK